MAEQLRCQAPDPESRATPKRAPPCGRALPYLSDDAEQLVFVALSWHDPKHVSPQDVYIRCVCGVWNIFRAAAAVENVSHGTHEPPVVAPIVAAIRR